MVDDIKYLKLPKITFPVSKDYGDDFAPLRGDYDGGLFGGYAGSVDSVLRDKVSASSGAGGTTTLNSTAVPAGYLWIVQVMNAWHSDATARISFVRVISGATDYQIDGANALGQYTPLHNYNEFVLSAGEYLRFTVLSASASVSLELWLNGYKVRL